MNTFSLIFGRRIKTVSISMLSLIAVGFIVFGLMNSDAQATSCPLSSRSGRYIVQFDKVLKANSTEAKASMEVSPVNIPPGNYRVQLVSEREDDDTSGEQWYVMVGSASGKTLATTPAIRDMKDFEDTITKTVSDNINISEETNWAIAFHASYSSSEPKSVRAVCAVFDRIDTISQLPSVTTTAAINIMSSSAELTSVVDPHETDDTVTWFEWGTTTDLGSKTSEVDVSTSRTSFAKKISGLATFKRYYYRAVARNGNGTTKGEILSFKTPNDTSGNTEKNSYSLSAYPAQVQQGEDISVDFTAPSGESLSKDWVAMYVVGDTNRQYGEWHYTDGQTHGTLTFRAPKNGTYEFRYLKGDQFTDTTRSNRVTVTDNPKKTLSVETRQALNVRDTSVVLVGYASGKTASAEISTWFEWGTDSALKQSTGKVTRTQAEFMEAITDLKIGTTYYFRATAKDSTGTVYGKTLSIKTGGNSVVIVTTPTPTSTPTPSVASKPAPATYQASISTSLENINCANMAGCNTTLNGNTLGYRIMVTNTGSRTLTGLLIKDQISTFMDFVSASDGGSANGQAVTWNIGTLGVGQSKVLTLTTRIKNQPGNATVQNVATVEGSSIVRKESKTDIKMNVTSGTASSVIGTASGTSNGSESTQGLSVTLTSTAESVGIGEALDFEVHINNTTGMDLSNAILRVTLPQEVTYVGSQDTNGLSIALSHDDNTLVIPIQDISVGTEKVIPLKVTINEEASSKRALTTRAEIDSSISMGNGSAQASGFMITTINPDKKTSGLVFGTKLIPNTFLGWLAAILLVIGLLLLLALIVRFLLGLRRKPRGPNGPSSGGTLPPSAPIDGNGSSTPPLPSSIPTAPMTTPSSSPTMGNGNGNGNNLVIQNLRYTA